MTAANHSNSLRFAQPLEHPPDFALSIEIDGEKLRVPIPKHDHSLAYPHNIAGNIEWRHRIRKLADGDPEMQAWFRALSGQRCPESCIYWINAFVYTEVPIEVMPDGSERGVTDDSNDRPFVTYPYQDAIVRDLFEYIVTGKSCAVDKARMMGLTWLIIAVLVWFWLHVPKVRFLVMSRVEELVDNSEDPDSLFYKIDYILQHLPPWMTPIVSRAYCKAVNQNNGSTIIGRSTNAKQGRGGRYTAAFLDEAAFMENLQTIWTSLSRSTKCRIANSTKFGVNFFSKLTRHKNVRQLRAPWWVHPIFGRGRYEKVKADGTNEIEIRSPWFDLRVDEAVDTAGEIEQELNMDERAGSSIVFPMPLIRRLEGKCAPPIYMGDIDFVGDGDMFLAIRNGEVGQFAFNGESAKPRWNLWVDLEEDENGNWRPPQSWTYTLFCDISWGQGRSNSAGVVKCNENGLQVGTFADANVGPEEFADLMVMAQHWWGGARGCAFLGWESNGGGGTFGRRVVHKLRSPWTYYRIAEDRRDRQKDEQRYGWASGRQQKMDLAGLCRAALARNEYILQDAQIVDELAQYVFYKGGGIGPAELAEESAAATATHGDRGLAAMGAHLCSLYAGRCSPPEREAPVGSPAWLAKNIDPRTGKTLRSKRNLRRA